MTTRLTPRWPMSMRVALREARRSTSDVRCRRLCCLILIVVNSGRLVLNGEVAAVVVRVAERRQVVTPRCLVRHVSETTRRMVRSGGLGGLAALSPARLTPGLPPGRSARDCALLHFGASRRAFYLGGGSLGGSPEEVDDGAGGEDRGSTDAWRKRQCKG